MSEESSIPLTQAPEEPTPQEVTLKDLMKMVQGLQTTLADVVKANETLAKENAQLHLDVTRASEESMASHLSPNRPTGLGDRAARSVTIATHPVMDSPNDPLWGPKVADPAQLTQRGTRP